MKSIREIYRIGTGPSSSHTMGPRSAAEQFLKTHPKASAYEVVLYGSLAATGKGHMTDVAITETLEKSEMPVKIIWKPDVFLPYHPNGMTFRSLNEAGFPSDAQPYRAAADAAALTPTIFRNFLRLISSLSLFLRIRPWSLIIVRMTHQGILRITSS